MLDLLITRTRYTEVFEGDPVDPTVTTELVENLELHEAVELCHREGVTFAATGTEWAALPDGSHTIDYSTGEVEEVTIHPQGSWWRWEFEAFQAGVDTPSGGVALTFGYLVQPA